MGEPQITDAQVKKVKQTMSDYPEVVADEWTSEHPPSPGQYMWLADSGTLSFLTVYQVIAKTIAGVPFEPHLGYGPHGRDVQNLPRRFCKVITCHEVCSEKKG